MDQRGGLIAAEARTAIFKQTFEFLSASVAQENGQLPRDMAVPEPPALWEAYQQVKHFGQLWWDGGLGDQPYWRMLEFGAIESGIQRFETSQAQAQDAMAKMQAALKAELSKTNAHP